MAGSRWRAGWAAAAVAAVVAAALAAPAGATVIGQERYSGTDDFSFAECGTTFDVLGSFGGHVRFRVDRGGQAFYVTDAFSFEDVVTNRATGKWFVVRGHGVFNEIKATLVSGNVYEFVAVEAGQPFVLEDAEGNVIVRDRGVIRHRALFDTLGDGMPGAILITGFEPVVHGPHPAFADDFPFCDIALGLTT